MPAFCTEYPKDALRNLEHVLSIRWIGMSGKLERACAPTFTTCLYCVLYLSLLSSKKLCSLAEGPPVIWEGVFAQRRLDLKAFLLWVVCRTFPLFEVNWEFSVAPSVFFFFSVVSCFLVFDYCSTWHKVAPFVVSRGAGRVCGIISKVPRRWLEAASEVSSEQWRGDNSQKWNICWICVVSCCKDCDDVIMVTYMWPVKRCSEKGV